MTNTKQVLRWMGIAALSVAALLLWAHLTLTLSDFAWWGFAIYFSPFLFTPVALAIRADLRNAKK